MVLWEDLCLGVFSGEREAGEEGEVGQRVKRATISLSLSSCLSLQEQREREKTCTDNLELVVLDRLSVCSGNN